MAGGKGHASKVSKPVKPQSRQLQPRLSTLLYIYCIYKISCVYIYILTDLMIASRRYTLKKLSLEQDAKKSSLKHGNKSKPPFHQHFPRKMDRCETWFCMEERNPNKLHDPGSFVLSSSMANTCHVEWASGLKPLCYIVQ